MVWWEITNAAQTLRGAALWFVFFFSPSLLLGEVRLVTPVLENFVLNPNNP